MSEASFQFIQFNKKNMGIDRKKINVKRFIGCNDKEENKQDIKNRMYLNKLEFINF